MLRYTVRQVPIERTFALRKAVLRPYLGPNEPYSLPDDYEPTTIAFAAESDDDGTVLSCARITPEAPPFDVGEVGGAGGAGEVGRAGETGVSASASAGGDAAAGVAGDSVNPGRIKGWRLRNMATNPAVRNQGVGAAVLQAAIDYVGQQGEGIFWCNARVVAQGLYARAGLQTHGEVWEEPDIGLHIVMWRLVP